MNEYLKNMQKELGLSEETCEVLEGIGIIITSKYGQDCHDYNVVGSPIDIKLIYSEILNIRDTEFLIEMGYLNTLVVSKDTVYEWGFGYCIILGRIPKILSLTGVSIVVRFHDKLISSSWSL